MENNIENKLNEVNELENIETVIEAPVNNDLKENDIEKVESKNDAYYFDDEIYLTSMKEAKINNEGLIFDAETNKIVNYFDKSKPTAGLEVEDYEQKILNTRKTIKDLDEQSIEQYKKWLKERHYNPKTKEQIENERLLAAAGLTVAYDIKGIRTVLKSDATGKPSVKIGRKSASIAAGDITDEHKIRVAVLSIKDKVKKPSIIEPSNASPQQALIFLRTATKILLDECDGKFELSDINIPNKHYRDIIMKEFEGYRVKASIGESNLEYNDDHSKASGIKQNKPSDKTNDEKIALDAAYNLFKATEATRNSLTKSNGLFESFQGIKQDNIVKGINELYAGKETDKKILGGEEQKQSFRNLLKSVSEFDNAMSKFETVPDNLKEAYSALNLLKETGFNPSSKNKTMGLNPFTSGSKTTIKNIAKNLQIVESLILKNTDMDVARLNKNDVRAVKKLNDTHREIKSAIENKDISKFSSYSSVVNSNDLNNVLSSKGGVNIFPKNIEVFKFAIAGEPADVYIFKDPKNGTMFEVSGSGNRYDKKALSSVSFNDADNLMKSINSFGVEEIKPELKQEIEPLEKVEAVKEEPVKEIEPEIINIDLSDTPLPPEPQEDFEIEEDFFDVPEAKNNNNFSLFDTDNLVEDKPELNANEKHNNALIEVLDTDDIKVKDMLVLVKVCNCCGDLVCNNLSKEQFEFNSKVNDFLENNKPNENNFHMSPSEYYEVNSKVKELSSNQKTEIEADILFDMPVEKIDNEQVKQKTKQKRTI